jgi:hypothetical protein
VGDANGTFSLIAGSGGMLSLPSQLLCALDLSPGDILSLTPGALSLHLHTFREFLSEDWEAVAPEIRGRFLEDFLRRPLVAIEDAGTLRIPPEVLPLGEGDRVTLQVASQGLARVLYLYPESPK